ncbi:F0F1 ATP synthase subunit delta [Paenibacillus thalictri]|uniref:ATP synthase subunit delta n=1 Tax=Paenibacillus thalictri TaxID=2527873 RepID=A0A4Q9DJ77_9BACL|nr:F0F1 ATP synthase subunit delta [Paenibacillus thalictri]TBL72951.1 F0F1 ATP synthase subunit delta [Paenibacillus thalictri]
MSRDLNVAKRYAKALFEVAQERNLVSQVEGELRAVVEALQSASDLQRLIQHPGIDIGVKKGLLKQIFEGKVSDVVFNTLQLLVDRRREDILNVLVLYYVEIANEALGQASAVVYSPFELSDAELTQIKERFGQLTGKSIRATSVVDKTLLGGIKVRIGDRLYDGSLSGKLQRIQKALNQSQAL